MLRCLTVVSVALLVGCGRTKKEAVAFAEAQALVCGAYEGRYAHGIEQLVVRSDGSFSQDFTRGTEVIYHNEGRWRLAPFEDHFLVHFEPFIHLKDAIAGRGAPEKVSDCMAHFYDDEPRIWFSRDLDYYVAR